MPNKKILIIAIVLLLAGSTIMFYVQHAARVSSEAEKTFLAVANSATPLTQQTDLNALIAAVNNISTKLDANSRKIETLLQSSANGKQASVDQGKKKRRMASDLPTSQPSNLPFLERVEDQLINQIQQEGYSEIKTSNTQRTIDELLLSADAKLGTLAFEEPVCSEQRCMVKGNLAGSTFTSQMLANDDEYTAIDHYTDFSKQIDDKFDQSSGRDMHVSISRQGDQIVMNIKPVPNFVNPMRPDLGVIE